MKDTIEIKPVNYSHSSPELTLLARGFSHDAKKKYFRARVRGLINKVRYRNATSSN